MPMVPLHTAYGTYREKAKHISLSSPFCGEFQLRKEAIDGVDVLLPKDMSIGDAQKSGWLLIHRKGASPGTPFSIRDMTILDK